MEHNAIQWLGAPSCQRDGYAFYKSVSSRSLPDGPVQVWKLGEFYFIRCGPQEPVCIAEVILLWEDQTEHQPLASTRLYFLPEDTPKGRNREHGEDEVLAVSRKLVLQVEDLVRWSCTEPPVWSSSPKPAQCGINGLCKPPQNSSGCMSDEFSEPRKHQTQDGGLENQSVKVVSYPQYCRFRSLQRRIQDKARAQDLQDPHLLALGGIILAVPNTRVMYCRDTFNHPTLESSTSFSWQFKCPTLSLRGRPRKRRGRNSKDSPTSSPSESWIERMKENVMGSVEVGYEGSWLPHPEEQLFLDQLYGFMERHGSPIHKVPNLGFKKIDLFIMYSVVKRLGGYEKVTSERLWKAVYNELGGCPGSTSAATCTRRHYERLILPYEEHLRGVELKIPEPPTTPKPRGIRGRKPLPRGRKPAPKTKEKIATSPHPTLVYQDGMVVVKRGRGRPPGKRNKATLMAQAKVLSQQESKANPATSQLHRPLLSARGTAGLTVSTAHKPKTATDLKQDLGDAAAQPVAPGVLFSALPRHVVGGSLSGFSPVKGMCPLDVFRNRLGLQRGLENPAVAPQDPTQHHSVIYPLQPKSGSPENPLPNIDQLHTQPHLLYHQHNSCSGCSVNEAAQRGTSRDGKNRPPLPPLRVLPLDLDCSVQVRQLMRTRLGSSQFHTFTRRLSEVLSQDLGTKPPCSPITPPLEQALPLNLSKRFIAKRAHSESPEPSKATMNGATTQQSTKRARADYVEQAKAEDLSLGFRSSPGHSGREGAVELKTQDEPADLSSPSRIRAFLLELPPFQVKIEDDLNRTMPGKLIPPVFSSQRSERARPEVGCAATKEVKEEAGGNEESKELPKSEEAGDPTEVETQTIQVEFKGENMEMEDKDIADEGKTLVNSGVGHVGDFSGQPKAGVGKMEREVETSASGLSISILSPPTALVLAQQS
ncbi:uncharacterized protein zgc:77151 isoform X2 [Thalassophryne amazonica]|uniref:uncharacterized protein zgc:77151 isoform X2 n=1 Tax=Thalassophryne amazonica TaxID=390379 RepID=UPI001470FD3A|nr:uncharacterized protein zgc:77151 isoform X2 [Thalassophryne amazonica]